MISSPHFKFDMFDSHAEGFAQTKVLSFMQYTPSYVCIYL